MDRTKQILIEKYRPHLLADVTHKPQQQPRQQLTKAAGQQVHIQKAMIPAVSDYSSVEDWLQVVVPMVAGWPTDLAKGILRDMLRKHFTLQASPA